MISLNIRNFFFFKLDQSVKDIKFLKKSNFNFSFYSATYLIFSFFIIYKFFFRTISFYGASLRREDWFIYQDWFRVAKNMTPREMQVFHRLTSLSTNEFNNVLRTLSVELIEEDEDMEEGRPYIQEIILSEHHPYKDIYKALYYYFLAQNEQRLVKNAINTKNALYYKDRYGIDVFPYLTSTEDDKMSKNSSVKTFKEH